MRSAANFAHKVLYRLFRQKHPILGELIMHWPAIVGLSHSGNATPLKITTSFEKQQKMNLLHIAANNASNALLLSYQQDLIIERIAVYLGYKAIHKIKIIVRS